MSYNIDLEEVITDAVNDAQLSDTPETEVSAEPSVEDSPAAEASPDAPETAQDAPESADSSLEVGSPANRAETPTEPQDEFERMAGVPATGYGGRENRIPYSRVKKITEKAVSEVFEAVTGRKLNAGEKAVDAVKNHVAKYTELEAKTKDYEARLDNVSRFEHMIENEPQEFLRRLFTLPAYSEVARLLEQAYNAQQGQPAAAAAPAQPSVPVTDDMPQPDQDLGDGTKVYSMEGLQALLAWRDKQVESRVTKQIEDRYKPIESEWQERRRIEAALPVIQAQIAKARTWTLFNENEAEITEALSQDPTLSLEGAYRQVVFPKLVAERNKVRQDVLQEVRQAPASTSVPSRSSKPTPVQSGNRSIEDIIQAEVDKIKRA